MRSLLKAWSYMRSFLQIIFCTILKRDFLVPLIIWLKCFVLDLVPWGCNMMGATVDHFVISQSDSLFATTGAYLYTDSCCRHFLQSPVLSRNFIPRRFYSLIFICYVRRLLLSLAHVSVQCCFLSIFVPFRVLFLIHCCSFSKLLFLVHRCSF